MHNQLHREKEEPRELPSSLISYWLSKFQNNFPYALKANRTQECYNYKSLKPPPLFQVSNKHNT